MDRDVDLVCLTDELNRIKELSHRGSVARDITRFLEQAQENGLRLKKIGTSPRQLAYLLWQGYEAEAVAWRYEDPEHAHYAIGRMRAIKDALGRPGWFTLRCLRQLLPA